jgi:hypothetical protein
VQLIGGGKPGGGEVAVEEEDEVVVGGCRQVEPRARRDGDVVRDPGAVAAAVHQHVRVGHRGGVVGVVDVEHGVVVSVELQRGAAGGLVAGDGHAGVPAVGERRVVPVDGHGRVGEEEGVVDVHVGTAGERRLAHARVVARIVVRGGDPGAAEEEDYGEAQRHGAVLERAANVRARLLLSGGLVARGDARAGGRATKLELCRVGGAREFDLPGRGAGWWELSGGYVAGHGW